MSHSNFAQLGRYMIENSWGYSNEECLTPNNLIKNKQEFALYLVAAILEEQTKLSRGLWEKFNDSPIINQPVIRYKLQRANINRVCQLVNLTRQEVLSIRDIGPARLGIIEASVARLGLVLRNER